MRYLKYAALLGILLFAGAGSVRAAQVRVGVGIGPVYVGPEPVCAYGYYPYYPYACAPYDYWGPSYFVGGLFVGAGPWYHTHWGPRYYGHAYYGRPGFAYRAGSAYRGAPAHGYVGGGYHGSVRAEGGFRSGSFRGGGGFHEGAGRGR
jgi:hypothetical protein